MNLERCMETFEEMVRIPSPSFKEGKMAKYCKSRLEDMGFDVQEDDSASQTGCECGNLIATLPGNRDGRLVLCAHLDTVVPCEGIEPMVVCDPERGKHYASRGETILSADDKAGIAAIFEAVESAIEKGSPRPDLIVLLTTCEEQSLVGASALAKNSFDGEDCFVLDASGAPGTVIMKAPCHWTFHAEFSGLAAHAGAEPESGRSAISAAALSISTMPLGRLDDQTTANVGMIDGGDAVNIVPSSCAIEGECRSLDRNRANEVKEAIEGAIMAGAAEAGCSVELDWNLDYPEIDLSPENPAVKKFEQAAEKAGIAVRHGKSGGGADANVLGDAGLNPVTLGIGMTQFHTNDEYITLDDLANDAILMEELIGTYAE